MISGTLAHAIIMLYALILPYTANDIPTSSGLALAFKRGKGDNSAILKASFELM
jgi:hypothetical protein